jgi:cellobionic acid phosphorylase
MPQFSSNDQRYTLESPTLAPQASGYLWNRRMMIQATCRGYAVAQFMQPEPAKYAHVPTLAGVSFMQPEQPFFTHHPGRFFYVRDDETGGFFSAPYEPARVPLERFEFSPGLADIRWLAVKGGLEFTASLSLTEDEVVELWSTRVRNTTKFARRVSLFVYFPVGYSSWMNLGGQYDPQLQAAVATCIAPYQKLQDYFKRREWKDCTYLMADRKPTSWDLRQAAFEGEGGLHNPSAVSAGRLSGSDALYELPACCLHFQLELPAGGAEEVRLVFGPAKDRAEIAELRSKLLHPEGFATASERYRDYVASGRAALTIQTPDPTFDAYVNHWLPRQVFYHGDTNRLTTDPQTRNYLQDAMGMAYIRPLATRAAMVRAVSQQKVDGEMPDGVLLYAGAELKYINQIPHTDHGVWLIICLQAYLNETNDFALLDELVGFAGSEERASVYEHLCRSLEHLLSYIGQGDWCDPMNMVGYKGRGVSGWLTEALAYALSLCLPLCARRGDTTREATFKNALGELKRALNEHFWHEQWYGRGITDDGVLFGVAYDREGRIFLNAQSWALLAGAPDAGQTASLLRAVDEQLVTPYGVQLCAPAFTAMREDVGRVTQKFPGVAENGSVYNHAAAFYAAALFHIGEKDRAFATLRAMLPGPDVEDIARRGQLPVYVPNYYRGAYGQLPRTAGRSSQLFNTGTVSWFYRLVIEQMFGLCGEGEGFVVQPQLPRHWPEARATRRFRDAIIELDVRRSAEVRAPEVTIDGSPSADGRVARVEPHRTYRVSVRLPIE